MSSGDIRASGAGQGKREEAVGSQLCQLSRRSPEIYNHWKNLLVFKY